MRTQVYYLIKPSRLLESWCANGELSDLGDILIEPQLWVKNQADRSVWNPADHVLQVKLLFAWLIFSPYEDHAEFTKLLADDRMISVELFDKWWTLEVYHISGDIESISEGLDAQLGSKFSMTKSPCVNAWIEGLRATEGGGVAGSDNECTQLMPAEGMPM
jgi:hypothetical protein